MNHLKLYIDRILYPVTALGPGRRIGIWVSGCNHHCFRCANPELWNRRPDQIIEVEKMAQIINQLCKKYNPDGLTITGGEPFDQATELSELLDKMDGLFSDILVYSGYRKEQLVHSENKKHLLERVDVLIDGLYIDELNTSSIVLRGSENQIIHYKNSEVKKKYDSYMKLGRQIQNIVYDYKIISVGIHSRE